MGGHSKGPKRGSPCNDGNPLMCNGNIARVCPDGSDMADTGPRCNGDRPICADGSRPLCADGTELPKRGGKGKGGKGKGRGGKGKGNKDGEDGTGRARRSPKKRRRKERKIVGLYVADYGVGMVFANKFTKK